MGNLGSLRDPSRTEHSSYPPPYLLYDSFRFKLTSVTVNH